MDLRIGYVSRKVLQVLLEKGIVVLIILIHCQDKVLCSKTPTEVTYGEIDATSGLHSEKEIAAIAANGHQSQ